MNKSQKEAWTLVPPCLCGQYGKNEVEGFWRGQRAIIVSGENFLPSSIVFYELATRGRLKQLCQSL